MSTPTFEWRPIAECPPKQQVLFWDGKRKILGHFSPDDGDGFGNQYVEDCTVSDLIEPYPTHFAVIPDPPTS